MYAACSAATPGLGLSAGVKSSEEQRLTECTLKSLFRKITDSFKANVRIISISIDQSNYAPNVKYDVQTDTQIEINSLNTNRRRVSSLLGTHQYDTGFAGWHLVAIGVSASSCQRFQPGSSSESGNNIPLSSPLLLRKYRRCLRGPQAGDS